MIAPDAAPDAALRVMHQLHAFVLAHWLTKILQTRSDTAVVFSTTDVAHDLFVRLLAKNRFQYYLEQQMETQAIAREIIKVELTSMIAQIFRRVQPEMYRLIRRVGATLDNSDKFRIFPTRTGSMEKQRYGNPSKVIYGLHGWSDEKPIVDLATMTVAVTSVPIQPRNRTVTGGRSQDAQHIISGKDLERLLEEIFLAIDSPASLATIRILALSRLPVLSMDATSIDAESSKGKNERAHLTLPTQDPSPEQRALRAARQKQIQQLVYDFLTQLESTLRRDLPRERYAYLLWYVFFDPEEPFNLEIAKLLNISDSSVSDYRKKLSRFMKQLKIDLKDIPVFTEELERQLRAKLGLPAKG
jgi:hypothetical protein